MISNDALINECGFTQSRVHSQLFMRFAGDKDLILMQKGTDDFKILITNTPGGIALKINFMHVLEVKLGWEMTKQDLTSDYGSILHNFSTIDGRHAVTLTQELQIEGGMLSTGLIERLYLQCTPLPATWC
jgi:hypothetical protein